LFCFRFTRSEFFFFAFFVVVTVLRLKPKKHQKKFSPMRQPQAAEALVELEALRGTEVDVSLLLDLLLVVGVQDSWLENVALALSSSSSSKKG